MHLWAISDLHVEHAATQKLLEVLPSYGSDWVVLAGDISDSVAGLTWALALFQRKFARVLWVPGNHELWTRTSDPPEARGEGRYQALVDACREREVLTPEDPFVLWPELVHGERVRVALLFTLYDYTYAPSAHRGRERALSWAAEEGILAADEVRLGFAPHASREAWCNARITLSEERLAASARDAAHVLVNHWPLRHDLVRLGRVPRYAPWCGTVQTDDWHTRFRAKVCVHGHLHMRATDERDGVRFEEVSLGYPGHYLEERGAASYLRQIL